jgi:hypothetical protein
VEGSGLVAKSASQQAIFNDENVMTEEEIEEKIQERLRTLKTPPFSWTKEGIEKTKKFIRKSILENLDDLTIADKLAIKRVQEEERAEKKNAAIQSEVSKNDENVARELQAELDKAAEKAAATSANLDGTLVDVTLTEDEGDQGGHLEGGTHKSEHPDVEDDYDGDSDHGKYSGGDITGDEQNWDEESSLSMKDNSLRAEYDQAVATDAVASTGALGGKQCKGEPMDPRPIKGAVEESAGNRGAPAWLVARVKSNFDKIAHVDSQCTPEEEAAKLVESQTVQMAIQHAREAQEQLRKAQKEIEEATKQAQAAKAEAAELQLQLDKKEKKARKMGNELLIDVGEATIPASGWVRVSKEERERATLQARQMDSRSLHGVPAAAGDDEAKLEARRQRKAEKRRIREEQEAKEHAEEQEANELTESQRRRQRSSVAIGGKTLCADSLPEACGHWRETDDAEPKKQRRRWRFRDDSEPLTLSQEMEAREARATRVNAAEETAKQELSMAASHIGANEQAKLRGATEGVLAMVRSTETASMNLPDQLHELRAREKELRKAKRKLQKAEELQKEMDEIARSNSTTGADAPGKRRKQRKTEDEPEASHKNGNHEELFSSCFPTPDCKAKTAEVYSDEKAENPAKNMIYPESKRSFEKRLAYYNTDKWRHRTVEDTGVNKIRPQSRS